MILKLVKKCLPINYTLIILTVTELVTPSKILNFLKVSYSVKIKLLTSNIIH